MENIIELKIDPDILQIIQSKTIFSIPLNSTEIVDEIMEYFSIKGIPLNKEALIDGNYRGLSDEERDKIIIYFYWKHNRGKKTVEQDFVSLKLVHKYLDISPSYENRFLRECSFMHSFPCPSCNETVKVKFKNLKVPEVITTVCPACNHILGSAIFANCPCRNCKDIIGEVESMVNNIPKQIENDIQIRYDDHIHLIERPLSEERLQWYADKNSSDLSKDEREIISYQPVDIKELKEVLGGRASIVISSMKQKKAIYERYILRKREDALYEIKKQIRIFVYYSLILGQNKRLRNDRLDLNDCDLSKGKVKHILITTYKYPSKYSRENHLEIVFENESFQNEPGKFSFQPDRYLKDEVYIESFRMDLPQAYSINNETLYEKIEELNPYFFNYESIEEHPFYNEEIIRPLFKSKVENNKYHFLRNKYRDCIIMVNVRLADLISFRSVEMIYTKEELKYLRNCILDFVFYTKDGYPVEVLELQRGEHHNDDEYIIKDKLKKSVIKRVGLNYKETF